MNKQSQLMTIEGKEREIAQGLFDLFQEWISKSNPDKPTLVNSIMMCLLSLRYTDLIVKKDLKFIIDLVEQNNFRLRKEDKVSNLEEHDEFTAIT